MKRVAQKFSRHFTCRQCERNIGEAVEQEERLCDEVETVSGFTYLGGRESAGGGCEAAVAARTRCGGLCFGSVVSCCMAVRPAILYGSNVLCQQESEMEFYEGQKDPLW